MFALPIEKVQPGDVLAFDEHEPVWVTAIKLKKDRFGFDLLYAPNGSEPRWRGFDESDRVWLKS